LYSFCCSIQLCVVISGLNVGKVSRLAYLQLLISRPLSPLKISDPGPGDEYNNFLPFKRGVIDIALVTDFTDKFFAFTNGTVMHLTNIINEVSGILALIVTSSRNRHEHVFHRCIWQNQIRNPDTISNAK
jgi:hypothetical protein